MRLPPSFPRPRSGTLLAVDIVAAAVLTTGSVVSAVHLQPRPPLTAVALAVLCATAVAWRRRSPEAAFVVSISELVGYQLLSHDANMAFEPYAVALTAYMVGRRSRSSHAVLLAVYGMAVLLGMLVHPAENGLAAVLGGWLLMVAAAMAAGRLVARNHRMAVQLAEVTARLRRDQDTRAARLAAEERARVARELHDVTAHSVSVMVIQASAARLLAAADEPGARRALGIAVRSGREAMDDLRRMMGILRRGEDDLVGILPDGRGIDELIARSRASGMDVHSTTLGDADGLPAATRFVLYRIVQEALTNAARHGGDGPVSVAISSGPHEVAATVTNPLPEDAARGHRPDAGHGLVGMRERVAVVGGELSAGATGDGAFRVDVRFPAGPAAARSLPDDVSRGAGRPGGPDARLGARAADLAVAGFWLAALGLEAALSPHRSGPLVLNLAGVAAMAIACFWRRRFPVAFAVLVAAIAVLMTHGLTSRDYATLVGAFTVTVPLYTVGAWAEGRRALVYLIAFELGSAAIGVFEHAAASGIAGPALLALVSWLAGRAVRRERLLAERLRVASQRLVEEEADHARLAVIGERARLARELHGLVASQVEAMVVQTEAAEYLLGFDRRRMEDTLEAVEQTGRSALAQMRATVGVLRADGERAPLEPQPGLDLLHRLVAEARERGRDVHLRVEGEPFPLPPAVDLVAYRILEEAVAAPAAGPVEASLRFADGGVRIELRGSGRGAWPTPAMRERVEVCDGRLEVSAADGRGPARLVAWLPSVREALVG
jgi:signal transduction histidine kinase